MRKLGRWCSLAVVLTGVVLYADASIRIVPLARDGHVLVSFELAEGFTDDIRTVIQSGLTTTFTYVIDLRLDVPLWIDKTMASASVSASVKYDNLTRRHHLARELNGRIEEALVTEDEQVMRRWMTTFERLRISETSRLEPNREYYVRVRAVARPQNAAWRFWRWNDGPYGLAKFTFIP